MEKKNLRLIAMVVVIIGVSLFFIGFHDVDLCSNEQKLSLIFGIPLTETSIFGTEYTLDECYVAGLLQLFVGYFTSLIGIYLFGRWG